ncbi:MAG: Hpt domain-containing protein [Bacillota bacterium]
MPYDTKEAAASLMIDEKDLLDILETYVAETLDILADCEKAIKNGDAGTLKNLFHTLKGSAANFRIHDLVDLAVKLENGCKSPDWKIIAEVMPVFKSELELFQRQVRQK